MGEEFHSPLASLTLILVGIIISTNIDEEFSREVTNLKSVFAKEQPADM